MLPNPSLLFRLEDRLARSNRRRRSACGQRPSEVAIGSMLPAAFESLVHGHSRPPGPLVVASVFWFTSTPSVPVAALYLARQQCQCFTSGNVPCLLSRLCVGVVAIHRVGSREVFVLGVTYSHGQFHPAPHHNVLAVPIMDGRPRICPLFVHIRGPWLRVSICMYITRVKN